MGAIACDRMTLIGLNVRLDGVKHAEESGSFVYRLKGEGKLMQKFCSLYPYPISNTTGINRWKSLYKFKNFYAP
jgi:hypothetical protein